MVVERYDGDGLDDMPGFEYPIRHWEIGNEPDVQSPSHTLFQGNSEAYLLCDVRCVFIPASVPFGLFC